jgi:hypothetical protein
MRLRHWSTMNMVLGKSCTTRTKVTRHHFDMVHSLGLVKIEINANPDAILQRCLGVQSSVDTITSLDSSIVALLSDNPSHGCYLVSHPN